MEKSCRVLASAAFPLTGSLSASDLRYEYNARSELTRVTRAGEVLYGYEYDLAGNLIWSCNGSRTNVYERNCLNQYTTVSDSDNDCIMRIAVEKIKPPPYSAIGSLRSMKYNCQDYAASLRSKYREIKNSKEARCRCKKKGRWQR